MRIIDLTGQRFGRLIVMSKAGRAKDGHVLWQCRCDCGNMVTVTSNNLRCGVSRSCGCLRLDCHTTHGKTHTKLFAVWTVMQGRCRNPKDKGYKNYGGRGIAICTEWLDFQNFYDWAMSAGYK